MFPAFLTTLLFSVSAVSGQRSARMLGGTEANFWRLLVAGAFLAMAAHAIGGGLSGASLPLFLISGVIGFGIGDLAFFQALPRVGSRISVLLVLCVSSPVAAVVEWLWLGTALRPVEIASAAAILIGVALAISPGSHLEASPRRIAAGVMFGLVAAACQGLGAVLSRKAFGVAEAAGQNIDGMTAAYQRIVGGIAIACIGVALAKRSAWGRTWSKLRTGTPILSPQRRALWRRAWPWVVVNGMSGSALGVSCFQWALKTTPTGIVLPIVATTPIVIIPFARYIEGERATGRSLLGGIIAALGAAVLAWSSSGE